MSTEEKSLLALKAHCQMTIEQCDKRLSMLHDEATPNPERKARGVSIADREKAKAAMKKRLRR